MGERPKGPMDRGWRPETPVGQMLFLDIAERLQQHQAEDTLPRSPRGLFYDLRPSGMGHGLNYVKQPLMRCLRGDHVIEAEGRCQIHGGGSRKVNPVDVSPKDVQEMLVKMRRAGIVREDWIEDARAPSPNVPYYSDDTAESMADYLLSMINDSQITYSPQRGQEFHLEVLVEAAGLIGRLARIAGPYGVPVYSGGGFDGLKGKRALASRASDRDVPTIVLRITDYDDAGLMMASSAFTDSHAWATAYYGTEDDQLRMERIALTGEQAAEHDLLDANGKAEADGLPVPVMDAVLRDAIEGYQDAGIRRQNIADGLAESAQVRELVLAGLNGGDDE